MRILLKLMPRQWRESVEGDLLEEIGAGPMSRVRRTVLLAAIVAWYWADRIRSAAGGQAPSLWPEAAIRDARHTVHRWRRRPLFTAIAVGALALSIGATTALFTIVDGILLKPLPYPSPERLVAIARTYPAWMNDPILRPSWDSISLSYPEYFFVAQRTRTLDAFAVKTTWAATLRAPEARELRLAVVSASYFELYGVTPVAGRFFDPADDRSDPGTVLISEHLWEARYQRRPSAIGERLPLAAGDREIAGIVPGAFRPSGNRPYDIWQPLAMLPAGARADNNRNLDAVGRLRSEVPIEDAEAELAVLLREGFRAELPFRPGLPTGARVTRLLEHETARLRAPLRVLLAGAILLLLMACANVAGFLAGDAVTREHEMTVRTALGADRGRLFRQLLVESSMLSAAGGTIGLLAATWGVRILVALAPPDLPRLMEVALDARAFGFAVLAVIASTLLFGTAPAMLLTRSALVRGMVLRGRQTSATRVRLQRRLAVTQVAIGVTMLAGAGLFARTMWILEHVDTGFERQGLVVLRVSLPTPKYTEPDRVRSYLNEAIERLERLPGSGPAAVTSGLPFATGRASTTIDVPAVGGGPSQKLHAQRRFVSNKYFTTMRIPIVAGRGFTGGDHAGSQPAAVVSREMAARLWPGGAIGKTFRQGGREQVVIGVAGDVRDQRLAASPESTFYVSMMQSAPWRAMRIAVRPDMEAERFVATARQAVADIDPGVPVEDATTMDALVSESLSSERYRAVLLMVFGAIAAVLVAVGLYGTIARGVVERHREIAVRLALGAPPGGVRRSIVRDGVALAAFGAIAGVPLAIVGGRSVATLLFGVTPSDPFTLAAVVLLAIGITAAASYVPARRASLIDPATALRSD